MKTKDLMTGDDVAGRSDTIVAAIADLLTRHNLSGVPAVNADKLVGIITRSDNIELLAQGEE